MRITVDVLGSARSRARKAMLLRPHTDGFDQSETCVERVESRNRGGTCPGCTYLLRHVGLLFSRVVSAHKVSLKRKLSFLLRQSHVRQFP